ncbi:GNAT family N-acetyltransferase [Neisseria sp. Ec49-e6-T10]|uniref:GNAT family N-acetyltransferase n=1 Tax=Neisseria sp. Ec49-e6-T10 TaxID=3140744 RepID=UPI003EB78B81
MTTVQTDKDMLLKGRSKKRTPELEQFMLSYKNLTLRFAQTPEELDAIQALRYQIFGLEMGSKLPTAYLERDIDDFDDFCDHLMVIDTQTDEVVGTYRLLNPTNAKKAGRLYSAGEFYLDNLTPILGKAIELGRSCVHEKYRTGTTINLLWQGLQAYVTLYNCDYLLGCASVFINNNPAGIHKLTKTLLAKHGAPDNWHVQPKKSLAYVPFDENTPEAVMPPLLKGYLRTGVLVCGEPSLDEDFGCVDYFIVQPMAELAERYQKHLETGQTGWQSSAEI